MNPITLKIDDVPVTLKAIQRNKAYQCNCENFSFDCDLKQKLCGNPTVDVLTVIEVIFNVRNTTRESWPVYVTNWELVDTDGYAYKARALCDALRSPRTIEPAQLSKDARKDYYVTAGTQVDFVLVFPELEKDKEISCVLFSSNDTLRAFEINRMKLEAMDLMQARVAAEAEMQAQVEAETEMPRYDFINRQVERLKNLINSRLSTTLTPNKTTLLENSIETLKCEIEQGLNRRDARTKKRIGDELRGIITNYKTGLGKIKAQEEERKKLDQTVEQLSQLPPIEFEVWFKDLLNELGYEKVTLTSSSNDEGIDVLAEFNGLKVAVQCKRWKRAVSGPNVQAFLGAMHHAGAQSGLFVTTGLFTASAKKMASSHLIELVDRAELPDWIQRASKERALQQQGIIALEQRHARGYANQPQTTDEVGEWEDESTDQN